VIAKAPSGSIWLELGVPATILWRFVTVIRGCPTLVRRMVLCPSSSPSPSPFPFPSSFPFPKWP
jgi:hypothetical protein